MSVVGTITVYRCDGADCDQWLSIDLADEIDGKATWYLGAECQFCPKCRHHIANQASIATDELDQKASSDRIRFKFARRGYSPAPEAANVH
ncbi:MAG: hypothetical protein ACJ79X_06790 [Gemmatimonadaceae bacterium]|jgi:hypothetical protein